MYIQPTFAPIIRICIFPVSIAEYSGDTLGAQNIAAHHANLKYRKKNQNLKVAKWDTFKQPFCVPEWMSKQAHLTVEQ